MSTQSMTTKQMVYRTKMSQYNHNYPETKVFFESPKKVKNRCIILSSHTYAYTLFSSTMILTKALSIN